MTAKLSVRDLEIITHWSGHDPVQVEADPRLLEMGRLLIHDGLTEVYNRRYFLARLHAEVQEQQTVVVAMLDLDGFKQVNDTVGHEGGDRVLQALAGLLQSGLPGAVVARLGGDEFALLFSGQPIESVSLVVEQFVRGLPEHWLRLGFATDLRFSAGIAAWPADGSDVDGLMRAADRALYVAKRSMTRATVLARDLNAEVQGLNASRPVSALLVGRQPIRAAILRHLAEAERGRGGLLVLRGLAGSGKSLLLEEMAEKASELGWSVLRARNQGEAGSYSPLAQLLGDSSQTSSYVHIARQLEALVSRSGKTCLMIDDLPNADLLSLFALRRLAATLTRRKVMIVGTARIDEQLPLAWAGFQAEGAAAGWLASLEVGGLSEEETGLLAESWLGSPMHPEGLAVLHQHAGGTPIHAAALLQVWNGTGDLVPGPGGWTLRPEAGLAATGPLSRVMIRQIQQLPLEVRELVGLAAVLGTHLCRASLADLSGASSDDLTDWVDRAVQARVLRTDGQAGLGFTHPLLREAAVGCLSPQTRRFAHRLVAKRLEGVRSAPAAEVARHFAAAGMTARAFPYHVEAGELALGSHDTSWARHHFQAAWKALPISVGEAEYGGWYGRLGLRLATASRRNGDPRAGAGLCAEVLAHRSGLEPEQVVRLLLEQGESARQAGSIPEAEEAHREAVSLTGVGLSESLCLDVQVLGLRLAFLQAVTPEQIVTVRRLADEAQRLGKRRLQGELMTLLATLLLQRGDLEEAAKWNLKAVPLLPIGSGTEASMARLRAGLLAGTAATARRWFQQALLAAGATGETLVQARLLRLVGSLERGAGNWRAAWRYYEQAIQFTGQQGSAVERDRSVYELGILLVWSGAVTEGIAMTRSAADSAIARGDRISAIGARERLSQALMAAGRYPEALDALVLTRDWLPQIGRASCRERV